MDLERIECVSSSDGLDEDKIHPHHNTLHPHPHPHQHHHEFSKPRSNVTTNATIESALLDLSPPSPSQRVELMDAIRSYLSPVTPTNSKRGSNSSPLQVKPVELQPKEASDVTTACLSLQHQQQHVQDHAIGATMAC